MFFQPAQTHPSIVADACELLIKLKEQTTIENAMNEDILFYIKDTKLENKHFFAASRIVEDAVRIVCNENTNYQDILKIYVSISVEALIISARYPQSILIKFQGQKLDNPITQIPFDKIKEALLNNLTTIFLNWENENTQSTSLIKRCYSQEGLLKLFQRLQAIEKTYKEINPLFDLKISTSFSDPKSQGDWISVDKNALNTAKILFKIPDKELIPNKTETCSP